MFALRQQSPYNQPRLRLTSGPSEPEKAPQIESVSVPEPEKPAPKPKRVCTVCGKVIIWTTCMACDQKHASTDAKIGRKFSKTPTSDMF